MNVLLAIKPEFAEKIFDGTKKYEFRKSIFKNREVRKVLVYASSPIKQIIGEFEIEEIINHDLDTLWDKTSSFSGITKEYFFEYFRERQSGFAIKIKSYKKYRKPKCIKKDFNAHPPQSFIYIKQDSV